MRRDEIRSVSVAIVSPRLDDLLRDQIQLVVIPSFHVHELSEPAAGWRQREQ
jgi:hypothetical protein